MVISFPAALRNALVHLTFRGFRFILEPIKITEIPQSAADPELRTVSGIDELPKVLVAFRLRVCKEESACILRDVSNGSRWMLTLQKSNVLPSFRTNLDKRYSPSADMSSFDRGRDVPCAVTGIPGAATEMALFDTHG